MKHGGNQPVFNGVVFRRVFFLLFNFKEKR